jgi:hypothetical protein
MAQIPVLPEATNVSPLRPFETFLAPPPRAALDPFLPFKDGSVNGREEPESGHPVKMRQEQAFVS